jgi:hypothetical protein
MTAKTKQNFFWRRNTELIRRGFGPIGIPGVVSRWMNRRGLVVEHSRRIRDVVFTHPNGISRTYKNLSFDLFLKLLDAIEEKST